MISIVVPVLNEARVLGRFLAQFDPMPDECELVVVDGGSTDGTAELVSDDVNLIRSERGRARQLNRGARFSSGAILLFLHADTFLPTDGLAHIRRVLEDDACIGGRFKVALDEDGPIYRLIERGISWRDSVTGGFTGDQAIFVRREVFERLGGFAEVPLLEDVDFARKLKRAGRLASLSPPVTTSARRWRRCGPARTAARMWFIKGLFLAGVSPFKLAGLYPDVR